MSEDIVETDTGDSADVVVEPGSGDRTEPETVVDTFKAITSQADFEARLKERLDRANKSADKKYGAQIKDLSEKLQSYENEKLSEAELKDKRLKELTDALAERDKAIAQAERDKMITDIGVDLGLPRKFWDRVRGDTVEDITADMQSLLEELPSRTTTPPPHNGTVRVQSTNTDGEPELSADAILDSISLRHRG